MRSPFDLPAARVPYPRIALISFMGYAIGHNVGLNTLSGGAVRYRAYSALGLGAKQIATIIAFGTVTFLLGAGFLLGLSLLTQAGMSGSVLHVHSSLAMLAGAVLLAAVVAYLWLVCTRHEPLRFRRLTVPIPKPRVAFAQLTVACADLLCAASVLYVLLPAQANISFAAFAGVYLIANRRRRDQQRTRRHRRIRGGAAASAAIRAGGSAARRPGRLPCDVLLCALHHRSRVAGRA